MISELFNLVYFVGVCWTYFLEFCPHVAEWLTFQEKLATRICWFINICLFGLSELNCKRAFTVSFFMFLNIYQWFIYSSLRNSSYAKEKDWHHTITSHKITRGFCYIYNLWKLWMTSSKCKKSFCTLLPEMLIIKLIDSSLLCCSAVIWEHATKPWSNKKHSQTSRF